MKSLKIVFLILLKTFEKNSLVVLTSHQLGWAKLIHIEVWDCSSDVLTWSRNSGTLLIVRLHISWVGVHWNLLTIMFSNCAQDSFFYFGSYIVGYFDPKVTETILKGATSISFFVLYSIKILSYNYMMKKLEFNV